MIARIILALVGWSTAASAGDVVQLRGSDSLAPLARVVAEAYMAERPDAAIVVINSSTGRGIKAVYDGTADGGLASAAIPPDMARKAEQMGMTLKSHTVAHDGIIAVVHPTNPVSDLSLEQLRAVFIGEITDWSRLGGNPGPISIYAMGPQSGTAGSWRQLVIGRRAIQSPRAIIVTGAEMRSKVAANPHAIGYAAGHLPGRAKALSISGVAATSETIRDGSYPLARALTVVSVDPPPAPVADFIRWFQSPDKGQKLVEQSGAAPITGGAP